MKIKTYNNYDQEKQQDFKDKLAQIKSSVDPVYLLHTLGFKQLFETSKELRCACIVHGGDNKTAFRFNRKTNTWTCFTHKCQERFGNDVIGLVRAVTGKDFMSAVDYLKQLCGDLDDVDFIKERRKKEIENFINAYGRVDLKPESVNEDSLKSYRSLGTKYFENRGYKKETLEHFEVGHGWVDKYGIVRSVIPIRGVENELLAYSLRDERKNADKSKKYILTPGFNKQECLYNIHNMLEYNEKLPIIIVEGFKSVWKLYEYGIKNVVAIIGSSITEGQQFLLCLYALKGAVLFLDNDEAGVSGMVKACKDLKTKMDVYPVFIQDVDEQGNGLDPSDLTKEQVYTYLNTYY